MLDGLTLEDGVTYNLRFAIMYRAERKKILHNQIHLAFLIIHLLE